MAMAVEEHHKRLDRVKNSIQWVETGAEAKDRGRGDHM